MRPRKKDAGFTGADYAAANHSTTVERFDGRGIPEANSGELRKLARVGIRIVRTQSTAYKRGRTKDPLKQKLAQPISLPTQTHNTAAQTWEGEKLPPLRMCGTSVVPATAGRATTIELGGLYQPKTAVSRKRQTFLLAFMLVFSLVSYLLVTRFIVTAVIVQGRSMSPTLQDGDRCFLNRWTLHYRHPQRGDLVVIKDPGHDDYAVKRIVGIPGEKIELKDGKVFLNGHRFDEPYLSPGVRTRCPGTEDQSVRVGNAQYFVLGDNRDFSEDSRYYGALDRERIVGLLSK